MANIAIFRINYKSDFILTLNSDAGWMTPFCIKFWTGAPSQAYFVGFDGTTYTHCAPVDGEPTKLRVQFDDHHLPIGDLKFQIGYHFTIADFPTSVEDEVINQASVIIEQDGEPAQVMLDFTGETAPEIQFALPAYANEAQRIANEQQRIENEQQRIANEEMRIQHEESRIAAEQTRQQNEQQRINQEQARVNEYASLKADAVAATGAANDAAALANQKAQLAADKAALAQSAANLANAKAQLAADKAALAASAAQLANDKASLAQQKAEYAQTQGGYAKDQGDYAKDQGDYAKAQGDYAKDQGDYAKAKGDYAKDQGDYAKEQGDYAKDKGDICAADHQTAVADHQTATADNQTAAADHQTAIADHNQAGNDHTRAESDHTRAESDHDAVELYVDSLGVFDLSKHNAVGGVLATYADLSAALTALNALDSKYKYGGMSFKFVQSSDNKYVQKRLMHPLDNASTAAADFMNEANWQGVDDVPTAGSDNLVKSGGVFVGSFTEKLRNGYTISTSQIIDFPINFKAGEFWVFKNNLSTSYQIRLYKTEEKLSADKLTIGFTANSINDVLLSDDYKVLSIFSTTPTNFTVIGNTNIINLDNNLGYYINSESANARSISIPGFSLMKGGSIKVKFSYPCNGATTLNINSTGDINIYFNDALTSKSNTWGKNEIVTILYDGTNYQAYPLQNTHLLFDNTEENTILNRFFKNIKVYGVPSTRRLVVRDVWKNNNNDGKYRIYIYNESVQSEFTFNKATQDSHIEGELVSGGKIVMDVDWSVLSDGNVGQVTDRNYISLTCYDEYLASKVSSLESNVNTISNTVDGITQSINELKLGRIYIHKEDLTEVGYYDSNGVFEPNGNLRSIKAAIHENAKYIGYYSSGFYDVSMQAVRFYENDSLISSSEILAVSNGSVAIPTNATHYSISLLKTYDFYACFFIEATDNAFVDTEASLRDAIWAQDSKNPFAWKSFTKAHVTFMNDGCKDDVNSFRLACEKYGVPYITTYQIPRLSASITFSDVDGNAKYFGRELIANTEYTLPVSSTDSFTKLRIYCDCRCPLLGQQVSITIKYYTSSSEYTSASETSTLVAGKTYIALSDLANVIKIGIIVTCGSELTLPYVNFCITPYDSTANNTTMTGAEIGKLIYQNYGEVMQHGDWLFNTLDKDKAYDEFINQSYVYKKQMEDAIGVDIKGIIALGGPNSGIWQSTEMGQKFMVRNYLYSNWFGTTPQYSIPRSGAYTISGQVFTFTTSVSLTVNSQYKLDVGNSKKDQFVVLAIDGTTITAAKTTNTNNYSVISSGNLYNTGNEQIGAFSSCAMANAVTTGYWYVTQNADKIADAISNNKWLIFWCHSEIIAACYEAMCKYISELPNYGTDIVFSTFNDMYNTYKSSLLQESLNG